MNKLKLDEILTEEVIDFNTFVKEANYVLDNEFRGNVLSGLRIYRHSIKYDIENSIFSSKERVLGISIRKYSLMASVDKTEWRVYRNSNSNFIKHLENYLNDKYVRFSQ